MVGEEKTCRIQRKPYTLDRAYKIANQYDRT